MHVHFLEGFDETFLFQRKPEDLQKQGIIAYGLPLHGIKLAIPRAGLKEGTQDRFRVSLNQRGQIDALQFKGQGKVLDVLDLFMICTTVPKGFLEQKPHPLGGLALILQRRRIRGFQKFQPRSITFHTAC